MGFMIHGRRENYTVDDQGNIGRPRINMAPSGRWKLRGLVRLNNFGHEVEFIPFAKLAAFIEAENPPVWLHKNGKPRYFMADNDHGTCRIMMEGVTGARNRD